MIKKFLTNNSLSAIIKSSKRDDKMKNYYYYVVLYKNNEVIPIPFETWLSADDYIYKYNLHAYITIK